MEEAGAVFMQDWVWIDQVSETYRENCRAGERVIGGDGWCTPYASLEKTRGHGVGNRHQFCFFFLHGFNGK